MAFLLLEQLLHQARFAFVKTFGVERLRQLEQLVIEVMAKFMDQRAQERSVLFFARTRPTAIAWLPSKFSVSISHLSRPLRLFARSSS